MSRFVSWVWVLVTVAASCAWAAPRPLVLVTLSDMAAIVQAVSGDLVEIKVVMPPGADPHAFTITAEQVRDFGNAALVVYAHSEYHEFEHAIKASVGDKPSLDWADYAAAGAVLHDVPGYPHNPHGPWLYLPNAVAVAQAVAARLENMGLPVEVLRARLSQFVSEAQAQQRLCQQVARERGLAGKPVLAIIPGVCDVIANFDLPIGDVLMAEGTGTVAGKRLEAAVARLRDGTYAAVVCPLSMRQSKQGEAARQVARDSGAPLVYVRFLDAGTEDTYLSLGAYNLAAIAGLAVGGGHAPTAPGPAPKRPWLWPLIAAVALVVGWWIGRSAAKRHAPAPAGGIFDS